MKSIFLIYISILCTVPLFAQRASLHLPALANQELTLYYSTAEQMHSQSFRLDATGEGSFSIPSPNYQGWIMLGNEHAGMIELIYSYQENMRIEGASDKLNFQTLEVVHSPENDYVARQTTERNRYILRLQWAQMYPTLGLANESLGALIGKVEQIAIDSLRALDKERESTPLCAVRFMKLKAFAQQMQTAYQQQNRSEAYKLMAEMENWADINGLAHCSSFYEAVFRDYLSLFSLLVNSEQEYAKSIIRTLNRLAGDDQLFFFTNSLVTADLAGWQEAKEMLLKHALENIALVRTWKNETIQQLIRSYELQHGGVALRVEGLMPSEKEYQKTLLFFYDSSCDICHGELLTLEKKHQELEEQLIRIVSISADTDQEKQKAESQSFPWADKLCDGKGSAGVNFSRFAITTTPTFILLDKEGILVQRSNHLKGIKLE